VPSESAVTSEASGNNFPIRTIHIDQAVTMLTGDSSLTTKHLCLVLACGLQKALQVDLLIARFPQGILLLK
jgi:hypothetical protein